MSNDLTDSTVIQ